VADHDPKTPAKADLARVPGLLDQYRQQRRAWLAQADELARMREEVRQAAEREAIDIVTAARRDVRRIIVEARRDLLVLTAQLHAAVEATDAPGLEAPPFTALLDDGDTRSRVEGASHQTDITREVVHEARKGVRSVLDEARAEIEALSSEAPAVFGHGSGLHAAPAAAASDNGAPGESDEERAHDPVSEGPVHELHLEESLAALDFQTRDLPIPTLARILGTDLTYESPSQSGDRTLSTSAAFEPLLAFDTPRLSELRSLLRDRLDTGEPQSGGAHAVLSPDVEPIASSPFAFDTAPKTDLFADRQTIDPAREAEPAAVDSEPIETPDAPRFTPPSRLFGEEDTQTSVRSARTFIGLFAATGALAVVGTLWWALSRDSAPLSAATPPAITEKSAAPAPPTTTPAVAAPAPGTLALTIEARRPSWIRAQIDGKDEAGRIYQAGETRHIYGARTVSIRAGDAGAVFVGLDGGTAKPLGADGAAATKQFAVAVTPAVATASDRPAVTTTAATAPAATSTPVPARTALAAGPASTSTLRAPAPAPAAQPPAATPRPTASGTADPPAAVRDGVNGGRPDLVQAAQQWLDAYQRRDRDAMNVMGAENVTVSDERSVTERFPAWQAGVQRNLDEVALELTGDVAVFTARMTERAESGAGEHVSRVSQFWQRRGGRWYVTNVRVIGEARLNQIIR